MILKNVMEFAGESRESSRSVHHTGGDAEPREIHPTDLARDYRGRRGLARGACDPLADRERRLCAIGLIAVSGYFGWRETRTVGELTQLIEPVPDIADVTYVPTAAEMLVVQAAVSPESADERPPGNEPATQRFWLLKTKLSVREAFAFCKAAARRAGWTVEPQDEGMLMLRRGEERMLIVVAQDWPLPETKVSYVYRGP